MKTHSSPLLSAALFLLLACGVAHAEPQAECTMHLIVQLTPDVPDPHDAGFLSSLVNDHPAYRLSWVRKVDMSFVALDLNGPGPLERCENVVDTMRHDGRVMSIYSEPEEIDTVSVAGNREAPKEEEIPPVSVSPYGFGALYWAALHPTQAWRILLPVLPDSTADTQE